MSAVRQLDVALGERSYPIWIGRGLLHDSARWRAAIRGRHVLVVSNSTVAPLYLETVLQGLDGLQVARVVLSPMIITFVSLLKDSSLASLITVDELALTGRAMATEYFLPLQIYVAVGVCYFAIAWPFSALSRRLAVPARQHQSQRPRS